MKKKKIREELEGLYYSYVQTLNDEELYYNNTELEILYSNIQKI